MIIFSLTASPSYNKPLYTHTQLHQTLSKEDEFKTFYIKNLSRDKEYLLRYVYSARLQPVGIRTEGFSGFGSDAVNVQHDCMRQWSRLSVMEVMWLVFPWLWNLWELNSVVGSVWQALGFRSDRFTLKRTMVRIYCGMSHVYIYSMTLSNVTDISITICQIWQFLQLSDGPVKILQSPAQSPPPRTNKTWF